MIFADLDGVSLREILERFFETSFNAIVITTADAGYKIVYANPQFCKMTGYALDELVGKSPKILQGEKTNPLIMRRMNENLVNGQHFHGAAINYRKNGEMYPVEWNICHIHNEQGEITHFISIQKELSRLKEIVTRLKNTNQHFRCFLQDISRAVDADSCAEARRILEEQRSEVTGDLVENSKIYSPELRADASMELFGEAEFFDCDNQLQGMLVEASQRDIIDAASYCREFKSKANIDELAQRLHESCDLLDILPYSNTPEKEFEEIGQNILDMANEIFYFEDFVGISSVLAELGSQTLKHAASIPVTMLMEVYQALFNDLLAWLDSIFIEQSSKDIHEFDASIVSSAKQLLMFLKMAE